MRSLVAGTAAVLIAATGCGGGGNDNDALSGSTTTPATAPGTSAPGTSAPPVTLSGTVNDHGTKDLAGADEVDVELDDFYFGPTFIKAAPGAQVKVELENEGKAPHTFTIDALKVDQTVQPGEDATVTVTLPASGPVAFYCKFHKAQGMQGAFYFAAGGSAAGASGSSDSGGAYGQ